ncbi:MAG: hypothetical protein ACYCW6_27060 [Candidatus Xenobia bacterium]
MGPGDSIDNWHIEAVLGQGAFGTVYRVTRDGATAALKWMTGMDLTSREERLRFAREVEIASALGVGSAQASVAIERGASGGAAR